MSLGLVNVAASLCARGLVSRFYRLPLTNAAVYNMVDIATIAVTNYVLHALFQRFYHSLPKTRPYQSISRHFYSDTFSLAVSRIGGITLGILATRWMGCPVRTREAVTISLAAFGCMMVATGDLKYYKWL